MTRDSCQRRAQAAPLIQPLDHCPGRIGRRELGRQKRDLGLLGGLVGGVDAGEVDELTAARLVVETLGVALLGDRQRRVDEHLEELLGCEQRAGHRPLGPEGGDEGNEHDQTRVDHQLRDLGHAADVLHAVGVGEPEVGVQTVPDVVAIEQVGVVTAAMKLALDQVGDRRLAGAGQTGEPQRGGLLLQRPGALELVDRDGLPADVVRTAQREWISPIPTVIA